MTRADKFHLVYLAGTFILGFLVSEGLKYLNKAPTKPVPIPLNQINVSPRPIKWMTIATTELEELREQLADQKAKCQSLQQAVDEKLPADLVRVKVLGNSCTDRRTGYRMHLVETALGQRCYLSNYYGDKPDQFLVSAKYLVNYHPEK